MVECTSVTVFAAIGAAFIGFKVLTLLKTLFDTFVASGVPVSVNLTAAYSACILIIVL